jgi:hypothetical protein
MKNETKINIITNNIEMEEVIVLAMMQKLIRFFREFY